MRRLLGSSSTTPTTGFLGPPESGNVIVLNDSNEEEEAARMTALTPKPHHLPLETPRLQLSSPLTTMRHPMGCKMVVVAVAPLIGCKVIVVSVEMRPTHLRLLHQKGCL
jgi:hypothetical protein